MDWILWSCLCGHDLEYWRNGAIRLQANLQERMNQHKLAVEEADRLRVELQRISDDRDERANQVG